MKKDLFFYKMMLWTNTFIVVCIFYITDILCAVFRDSTRQDAIFYRRFRNIRWVTQNTVLEVVYIKNLYECSLACITNVNCKAFHIDEGPPEGENRACELLEKDGAYALWEYFTNAQGISYYDTHRK